MVLRPECGEDTTPIRLGGIDQGLDSRSSGAQTHRVKPRRRTTARDSGNGDGTTLHIAASQLLMGCQSQMLPVPGLSEGDPSDGRQTFDPR